MYYFISSHDELDIPSVSKKNEWELLLDRKETTFYNSFSLDTINKKYYVKFESEAKFEQAIQDDLQNVFYELFFYLGKEMINIEDRHIHLKLCRLFQLLFGSLFQDEIEEIIHSVDWDKKFHFSYSEEFRFLVCSKDDFDRIYDDEIRIYAFHKEFFKEIFHSEISLTNTFLHLNLKDSEFSLAVSAFLWEEVYELPEHIQTKLVAFKRRYKIDKILGRDTLYSKDLSMEEIKKRRKKENKNNQKP